MTGVTFQEEKFSRTPGGAVPSCTTICFDVSAKDLIL
jgi:hypothetical protein